MDFRNNIQTKCNNNISLDNTSTFKQTIAQSKNYPDFCYREDLRIPLAN